jgi:uracil-DNA glycosylase
MDSTTVYLEDVQAAKDSEREHDENLKESASPSSTPASSQKASKNAYGKRQRTLLDMFAGGASNSSEPSIKKARVSDPNPTPSPNDGPSKPSGLQKLNSIPFSLSEYKDSLTEEQKNLLRLECEVMGLTW